MCLHPRPVEPVPQETARVARAAFPKDNAYLRMREELGTIFEDEAFTALVAAALNHVRVGEWFAGTPPAYAHGLPFEEPVA